jgi:hypothetical protein
MENNSLELTREEKEQLVARITELAFAGTLNRQDCAEIYQICVNACRRSMAEIRQMIGPPSDVIQ